MRTTLDLPADLVDEARNALGFKSKTDTVVLALRELVRRRRLDELRLSWVASASISTFREAVAVPGHPGDRRRYVGVGGGTTPCRGLARKGPSTADRR